MKICFQTNISIRILNQMALEFFHNSSGTPLLSALLSKFQQKKFMNTYQRKCYLHILHLSIFQRSRQQRNSFTIPVRILIENLLSEAIRTWFYLSQKVLFELVILDQSSTSEFPDLFVKHFFLIPAHSLRFCCIHFFEVLLMLTKYGLALPIRIMKKLWKLNE